MKTISKTAVAIAAGMLFSMGSAQAADLGGNCCADLEERVAELEATTARKGNRKVSLTISGQVNRLIMSFDSSFAPAGGLAKNTYWGLDNTNTSSRFNLTGRAKIDGTRNAGFNMTIEVGSGGRSVAVSQARAEAPTVTGHVGTGDLNDHSIMMRDANVWLEDTRLGRVTLGRLTQSGPQGTIDLGGIGVIAPGTVLVGNGLLFATGFSIGAGFDQAADYNKRIDGIRYESPTWQGFQLAASYGEASKVAPFTAGQEDLGNAYAVNLRYANEFNGVRVAAAIGYERLDQDSIVTGAHRNNEKEIFGLSGSLMHVPTGLFVQTGWSKVETDLAREGTYWHIAAGVTRNWFGIGNTSLYGEYGIGKDMFFVHEVAGSALGQDMKFWGLGVVQNIDAAAMELYASYRNFSTNIATQDDIGLFTAGARIRF
ncbi:MAG TPA: hypothetical protein PK970_05795 [Hyphomicrobiaceae bacterium]|nr:hypothetical protein [Hyphomicrobiaceae bacterium]